MEFVLDNMVWEMRQEKGNGTALYTQDTKLATALTKLISVDLDQMVSENEAISVSGGKYLLTRMGYDKFIQTAERLGNSEIVKLLHDCEKLYWFRDANEFQ